MPLSDIYPFGTPLKDVKTYDGEAPFATHTHIYVNRSGPDDPPRRRSADYAASDLPRSRTRDAMFGASKPPSQTKRGFDVGDEDEPLATAAAPGEIVAKLPPLPEGTHYEIELREEGYVVLVEEGEPLGPYDLPEDRVGDRLFAPPGGDPRLKKMNRDARRLWRDQNVDVEHQVFMYKPAPNERLELRGPDENGTYQVVITGPAGNITGRNSLGGIGASRTGDKLRQMNAANRKFWSGARR